MRTKIIALVLIMASTAFIIGSIYANKNNSDEREIAEADIMPGYTQIDAVQGVTFFINSNFVDKATAVTQVSDSVSFQKNQFYSYKNGIDKYLLFNMEGLIVAAQKGTDFGIAEAADKQYALENTSLLNIWFTPGTKKFDTETENGVTTTIASAGVSINSKTYADFTGKLINMTKDGEEWSLYVGVPGTRYDKLGDASQKGIDTITNTFKFGNSAALLSQDVYAVSISGDGSKEQVETTVVASEDDDSLNLSNQNTVAEKEDDKAYTSTPYNMLFIGDLGLLSAFDDYKHTSDDGEKFVYEEPIVRPTKVYRGEEAVALIQEFCNSTKQYEYFDAPEGSQWEIIEYDLNYKNCEHDDYVNVKLKGLDGEYLKYRGIKYTPRSYDMKYKIEEDGDWQNHYFSYYAVPNGCYEYCIEFGEDTSITDQEVSAAYYHITNEEYKPADVTINPEATTPKEEKEDNSAEEVDNKEAAEEAEQPEASEQKEDTAKQEKDTEKQEENAEKSDKGTKDTNDQSVESNNQETVTEKDKQ